MNEYNSQSLLIEQKYLEYTLSIFFIIKIIILFLFQICNDSFSCLYHYH